jgi:hypothetical protein
MTDTTVKPEIATYDSLPNRLFEPLWAMYTEAFEPMRRLAAQRHVMFRDEYVDLVEDRRVTKIVATDGAGVAGLAVVTSDLKAVPLIEPEYFEHLEPEFYARGHVWYTVFVCTRQGWPHPPRDTFARLIDKVAEPIRPVRGVCYMDYAQVRVDGGLPWHANNLLREGHAEAVFDRVDAQTYYGYYPGGRPA